MVKSVVVDEMASEGSVSDDRHEEASVIRGHRLYKSVSRDSRGRRRVDAQVKY